MWSVQSDKIKQHKKRVNYTINKHTIDRFKVVADKDMRKMSNIVENLNLNYFKNSNKKEIDIDYAKDTYDNAKDIYIDFKHKFMHNNSSN